MALLSGGAFLFCYVWLYSRSRIAARHPCATFLILPFRILCKRVLEEGSWPNCWRLHRIAPIFKKGNPSDPNNFRGIHLTSHISKVVERMLKYMMAPILHIPAVAGRNQFAYLCRKGARDALAYFVLTVIGGFARGVKFGILKADVSGAFDRVPTARFMAKLEALGVPQKFLNLIAAWLSARHAFIELGKQMSEFIILTNQVFQGTVLGPLLWNAFFADSIVALEKNFFEGLYFADDLHAFKEFDRATPNSVVQARVADCQASLHEWGAANQVVFDPAKESTHVLSLTDGDGSTFVLLGALFDANLSMTQMCLQLVQTSKWKIACILRSRAFHDNADLLHIFKAKIWSYLEYRTSVIYHCNGDLLAEIDSLQERFLAKIGMCRKVAALHYSFLPLCTRRDIAMLGMLHRTRLGHGPSQFNALFPTVSGSLHISNPYVRAPYTVGPWCRQIPHMSYSAFGLIRVYNSLDKNILETRTVHEFQSALTAYIKSQIRVGLRNWDKSLCPRLFGQ